MSSSEKNSDSQGDYPPSGHRQRACWVHKKQPSSFQRTAVKSVALLRRRYVQIIGQSPSRRLRTTQIFNRSGQSLRSFECACPGSKYPPIDLLFGFLRKKRGGPDRVDFRGPEGRDLRNQRPRAVILASRRPSQLSRRVETSGLSAIAACDSTLRNIPTCDDLRMSA